MQQEPQEDEVVVPRQQRLGWSWSVGESVTRLSLSREIDMNGLIRIGQAVTSSVPLSHTVHTSYSDNEVNCLL